MKRDLKADLEQVRNFRSKWRQSTSLEEAWDIGVAWEHFCREKAELWAELWLDQALAEKERADKAEALVRELVELLKEADNLIGLASYLISDGSVYSEDYGEFLTRCDTLDFRMKEVLGDEN